MAPLNVKQLFVNILATTSIVLAGFVEQKALTEGTITKELSTSMEPSILQCLHRCKFIDKKAVAKYDDNGQCKCIIVAEEKEGGTISGLFMPKVTFS